MTEAIVSFFQSLNMSEELIVFLISMFPIVELRGAIPVGVVFDIPSWELYLLAVLGNMLPIPFILWLGRPIVNYCLNSRIFRKFGQWLHNKVEKNKEKILKYGTWGLMLFVAIPLPGTGAWTGALAAALIDLRIKKAVPSILLGVVIAGAIMLFGSNIIKFIVELF